MYPKTFEGHRSKAYSVYSISLSLAAFAFVGVEIPAATALEVRAQDSRVQRGGPVDRTVKFSGVWGALMVASDLLWDDPNLPRLSWPNHSDTSGTSDSVVGSESADATSNSAFVIAASNSEIGGHQVLADSITVCLLITALTAANTALYVASRTLFSLTTGIEAGPNSPWITKFLAYFGKTNGHKVPIRALAASSCFSWVLFLYLSNKHAPTIAAVS